MNALEQRFRASLQIKGVRITQARLALFQTLQEAHEPLPLPSIVKQTRQSDRASVYRNIELFEQLGAVNALLIGWKKRYELAAPLKGHHHHVFCETCGKVVSIESPALEGLIKTIAETKGFELRQHTLELSGRCRECKTAQEDH